MNEEELLKELDEKAKEKEAFAKAKAEQEVKELSIIAQDPNKALQTKLNLKIAEHIDSSTSVSEKISHTAEKLVDNGLLTQENKVNAQKILSEDETLEADFQKNKDEYLFHGIDHKIDKKWKRNIIHIINDIWFVLWAFVSFFTIVPVSTFLSRINALKGFIKGVALIIGILLLLSCVGSLTFMLIKWTGVL